MKTIGLISDTHGFLDEKVFEHFADCDAIWHLGDIGSEEILKQLQHFKPLHAVFGNIDSKEIRWETKEFELIELEQLRFLLIHIIGKPLVYTPQVRNLIKTEKPDVIVFGHSHVVLVKKDEKNGGLVLINPGAAGKHGFHKERTMMKMVVDNKKITKLDLIKLGAR